MSYAQHNCSSLVSNIRANARALIAELEKHRQERAAIHRETMELINKELAEMQSDLRDLNNLTGYVLPASSAPITVVGKTSAPTSGSGSPAAKVQPTPGFNLPQPKTQAKTTYDVDMDEYDASDVD